MEIFVSLLAVLYRVRQGGGATKIKGLIQVFQPLIAATFREVLQVRCEMYALTAISHCRYNIAIFDFFGKAKFKPSVL